MRRVCISMIAGAVALILLFAVVVGTRSASREGVSGSAGTAAPASKDGADEILADRGRDVEDPAENVLVPGHWLDRWNGRMEVEPDAVAAVVEQRTADQVRVRHPGYEVDVDPAGLEFRMSGDRLRFSRGPASRVRKVSESMVELTHDDGVVERLESKPNGVEQSFVFYYPVRRRIIVEGMLESNLEHRLDRSPGAGLDFLRDGEIVFSYRKAVAVDARGRRLDLPINYEDGKVRMVIPEGWLALAAWPVVLDPIIGTPWVLSTGVEPLGNLSHFRFAAAPVSNTDSYLTAWYQGSGYTVQLLDGAGLAAGAAFGIQGMRPQIAYMASSQSYLLVYDDGAVIHGQRFDANGNQLGSAFQVLDEAGDVDISPAVEAGSDNHWLVVGHHGSGTVYGRFVSANGTLSGGAINLSGVGGAFGGSSGNSIEPPRVAYLPSDDIYGVLCRDSSAQYVVYGVDGATNSLSWSSVVNPAGFTRAGDIAAGPDRFLVAWTEFNLSGSTWWSDAEGKFVLPNGTVGSLLQWDDTTGSPSSSFYILCSVDYSSSANEYLVSYGKDVDAGVSGDGEHRVVRVAENGTAAAAVEVIASGLASAAEPVLAAGANKRFLILGRTNPSTTMVAYMYQTDQMPFVSIDSPANGTTVTTSPVTLSGTADAPGGSIAGVTWANETTGAGGSATGTTSWTAAVPLTDGDNVITITATDGSGSTATDSITVTLNSGGGGGGGGHTGGTSGGGRDSSSGGSCGSVGLDIMLPLGLILLYRRFRGPNARN